MPPKKNDENTAKKPPKKRVVKAKLEKPQLKTPTVIRLKIPVNGTGPNGVTPKVTKKQLADQRKLEMTNEVAHAQLCKESRVVLEPAVPITGKGKRKSTADTKDGPKPTKRKKILSKPVSEQIAETSSEDAFESKTPIRKPRKKPVPKKIDSVVVKDELLEPLSSYIEEKLEIIEESTAPVKKPRGRPKKQHTDLSTSDETTTIVQTTKTICKSNKTKSTNGNKRNSKLETTIPIVVKPGSKASITTPKAASTRSSNKVTNRVLEKKASDTNDGAQDECKAGVVKGRKASNLSSTSGMSWTQDVSTSSTTTCVTVTSYDFVRFDRKLPVLQIADVRSELKSSSDSGSKRRSSASSPTDPTDLDRTGSLDLSASTVASAASSPRGPPAAAAADARFRPSEPESGVSRDAELRMLPEVAEEISAALRLSASVGDYDGEMVDWIGRGGERGRRTAPPALCDALQLESDTVALCRALKRAHFAADVADADFVRPAPPRGRARPPDEPRAAPPEERADDSAPDRARFVPCDASADDDDALSLFAESITAIDSGRHPSAALEEYVPAPVAPSPFEPLRYRPTRIEAPPWRAAAPASAPTPTPTPAPAPVPTPTPTPAPLPADLSLWAVASVKPQDSVLFRGMCFYYLTTGCRFEPCRYSHVAPAASATLRRAAGLGDAALLRETALMLAYPGLRVALGATLAAELARRGLTCALLETAATLLARPGAGAAAQAALEEALAALSRAELPAALLELPAGAVALCDALLRAVAHTQNFSRFRAAFVRLAAHCATHPPGRVPHEVLLAVLERLSILPCDEALARAMVRLVALADPSIYRDRMMAPFEAQLSRLGGGVCEEFLRDKTARRLPSPPVPPAPPAPPSPPAPPAPLTPLAPEAGEGSTSPDITHYDPRKNLPIEPIITRTVDFSRDLSSTKLVKYNPGVPPPMNQVPKSTGFSEWRKAPYQNPDRNRDGVVRNRNGFVRNPNGIARNPNGVARNPNGFARNPNGFGRNPNGFARIPNGVARNPNSVARNPSNVIRSPNAVNLMMLPSNNPMMMRRSIKRRPGSFQRMPQGGDFYD